MKKIHISLVGGQPIPVYLGIKDNGQANTIVLVCSAQSNVEAERIKAQFPKREFQIKECSPTNLHQIENLAQNLREQYNDCEVTINLTSGTKLWALSFYQVFSIHGSVHFIYVDQTNLLTNLITKETRRCDIDISTRFELYGTPLKDYRSINEYTSADFEVMRKVERIRKVNKRAFTEMTNKITHAELEVDGAMTDSNSGSTLEWTYLSKWAKMTLNGSNGTKVEEFESEHVFDILFHAGWFELKVAEVLRKTLPEAKDIRMNGMFVDSDGLAKNEFDIIVDCGTRLLFVECKTMVFDTTDIDKFRSALRNFSGTSSSGLFVTYEKPKEYNKDKYKLAMEKCRDNDIQTFNYSLWNQDREHELSLSQIVSDMISKQNKR